MPRTRSRTSFFEEKGPTSPPNNFTKPSTREICVIPGMGRENNWNAARPLSSLSESLGFGVFFFN